MKIEPQNRASAADLLRTDPFLLSTSPLASQLGHGSFGRDHDEWRSSSDPNQFNSNPNSNSNFNSDRNLSPEKQAENKQVLASIIQSPETYPANGGPTPRTDALQSARLAFENSIKVSELLFPDEELSVASSIGM